jgi:hypothetical protein
VETRLLIGGEQAGGEGPPLEVENLYPYGGGGPPHGA